VVQSDNATEPYARRRGVGGVVGREHAAVHHPLPRREAVRHAVRLPGGAGNRRFGPLSVLRAHTKLPYKTDLPWKTPRARKRPGGPGRSRTARRAAASARGPGATRRRSPRGPTCSRCGRRRAGLARGGTVTCASPCIFPQWFYVYVENIQGWVENGCAANGWAGRRGRCRVATRAP
jgi:hypothetical protein